MSSEDPIYINPTGAAEQRLWSEVYIHTLASAGRGRSLSSVETSAVEDLAVGAADRAVMALQVRMSQPPSTSAPAGAGFGWHWARRFQESLDPWRPINIIVQYNRPWIEGYGPKEEWKGEIGPRLPMPNDFAEVE